ncbi:MAG: hypothetical protein R3C32_11790 [Chloroflexota bacterium]
MAGPYPRVAELLADAEARPAPPHFAFPEGHRARIRSTNPLELADRRWLDGVSGSSPTGPPVIRLRDDAHRSRDDGGGTTGTTSGRER